MSDEDSIDRPDVPTMNIAGVESPSSDDGSEASDPEQPHNAGVHDENAGVHLEVENNDTEIKHDENTGVQNEPVETNENVDNTGVHDEIVEAETTAPDTDTNAPAEPTDDIENESDESEHESDEIANEEPRESLPRLRPRKSRIPSYDHLKGRDGDGALPSLIKNAPKRKKSGLKSNTQRPKEYKHSHEAFMTL